MATRYILTHTSAPPRCAQTHYMICCAGGAAIAGCSPGSACSMPCSSPGNAGTTPALSVWCSLLLSAVTGAEPSASWDRSGAGDEQRTNGVLAASACYRLLDGLLRSVGEQWLWQDVAASMHLASGLTRDQHHALGHQSVSCCKTDARLGSEPMMHLMLYTTAQSFYHSGQH